MSAIKNITYKLEVVYETKHEFKLKEIKNIYPWMLASIINDILLKAKEIKIIKE